MGYRGGDETVILEGTVEFQTAKARLVEFTTGGKEWLPNSQVVDVFGPYGENMDKFEFHVTDWWARKNGFA